MSTIFNVVLPCILALAGSSTAAGKATDRSHVFPGYASTSRRSVDDADQTPISVKVGYVVGLINSVVSILELSEYRTEPCEYDCIDYDTELGECVEYPFELISDGKKHGDQAATKTEALQDYEDVLDMATTLLAQSKLKNDSYVEVSCYDFENARVFAPGCVLCPGSAMNIPGLPTEARKSLCENPLPFGQGLLCSPEGGPCCTAEGSGYCKVIDADPETGRCNPDVKEERLPIFPKLNRWDENAQVCRDI